MNASLMLKRSNKTRIAIYTVDYTALAKQFKIYKYF